MTHASRSLRAQVLFALIVLLTSYSVGQVKTNRITGAIDDTRIARMKGNVHPMTSAAQDLGPVDSSFAIDRAAIYFKPSPQQQAALDKLLDEQQDPTSPNYHQWLTPAQFGDRFGLSPADFAKVSAWLTSRGLRILDTPRSRTYIAFSGSAQRISGVFRTPIHHFAINGEKHFANSAEPAIPAALSGIVEGLGSLNDFRPHPRATVRHHFTSNLSGNHFIAPDDFATIYNLKSLYNNGNDGTGQTIAVMGQTNINVSDTTTFRSVSGLPAKDPVKMLIPPGAADPGIKSGDIFEANLDVQWTGAVAPKATILYVYSNNTFSSLDYAISNNLAPIISISYGDCEAHFSQTQVNRLILLGQQAGTQGQTILAASGDSGAADCDFQVRTASEGLGVDLPAGLPYVTGVGGTTLNENGGTFWNSTNNANNGSAISYIPEVAWNDTAFELTSTTGTIAASGGGKSGLFTKPTWQTGTGVPADNARDVPDISLAGSADHDGYLICSQGSCVNGYRAADTTLTVAGGTSVGAPAMAGIVALISQKVGGNQGNINPTLYSLAASAPNSFHDITTGDNKVPCLSGSQDCPSGTTTIGFTAGTGYDQVTGLGTLNVSNLVTQWPGAPSPPPDFQIANANGTLTVTRGTAASTFTQNVTINAVNGFTGTINLSCAVSTSLTGVSCSLNPTSLTNSGSSSLTINIPPKSSAQSGGTLARLSLSFVAGFFFIGALGLTRKSKRTVSVLAFLALAVLLALTLVGCGGGSGSNTNPGGGGTGTSTPLTGTVTVTAASGATTHVSTISVTVN